jgi:uncharacterized protein (DUF2141 family)
MRLRGLGAFCIAAVTASVSGWGAELIVVIDGVRNDKGDVIVSVYASPKQWPDGNSVADLKEEARLGSLTFRVHDLPPGTYGVTAFHDENRNGKLDTNFFGFPLEGFAFSNDVHPILSSPSFKAVSIQLGESDETITMHMQYLGR